MPDPDLLLRPWSVSDAPALREAIDEDVSHLKPWLSWTLEEPATLERTRVRLRGFVDEYRTGEALRYAVTPMDRPSRILGGAHLKSRVGPMALDVGYWVRASAVRQGIAAAAVSKLVVHAFEERDVERLIVRCDVANGASAAFARALGFDLVRSETTTYPDGAPRPVNRFELSREGYDRRAPELRDRARRVRLATEADEGWLAFLAELEAGHRRLESLAAGVAESERETAGACGVWSARQLLAHLEAWNVEILGNLRRLRDGGAEVPEHDVDEFNRRAVRAREEWGWTTVTTRLRESQRRVRRHFLLSAGEGRLPSTAEREWIEVLISHDRHHAAQLDGWMKGGG